MVYFSAFWIIKLLIAQLILVVGIGGIAVLSLSIASIMPNSILIRLFASVGLVGEGLFGYLVGYRVLWKKFLKEE